MRPLAVFLLALLLIGGGLKAAGVELPIIDYPLGGGPLTQPQIEILEPDLGI